MKHYFQKGFTLVELLVVIAVLAILSTISIVGYTSFIEKSAISTDAQLVTQLNNFKDAYEIANNEQFTKDSINKMLEEANITEVNLQSEKYGYGIYYNIDTDSFELIKQSESNNNTYINLSDTINQNNTTVPDIDTPTPDIDAPTPDIDAPTPDIDAPTPDIDAPTPDDDTENNNNTDSGDNSDPDNNNTENGNDNSESEGNSGSTDNSESDDNNEDDENTNEIVFTVNVEYSVTSDNLYAKYNDKENKLEVGNSIYHDSDNRKYTTKYIEINLNELVSVNNGEAIEFTCATTNNTITYDGYTQTGSEIYTNTDGNTYIRFYEIGSYILSYAVGDKIEYMNVSVYNVSYDDAIIEENKKNQTIKSKNNNDGTYNANLQFANYIKVEDYFLEDTSDRPCLTMADIVFEKLQQFVLGNRIKVKANDVELSIININNIYYASIENLSPGSYSYKVTFMYQGYNGVWKEFSLQIKFKVGS